MTSGRHAIHLEQGAAGAAAVWASGTECTYDPLCYAGCPHTPVFDPESRPAELFQLAAGGRYSPAAYKTGLALAYWLMPGCLWAAAALLGIGRAARLTAAILAVAVAWSRPAEALIEAGDLCLPLTAVLAVLGLALLARWHERPCPAAWLGLTAVTAVGWAVHPSLWLAFTLLGLGGWAAVARRHRWAWHIGLALAHAAALAVTWPALDGWASDWWVRLPERAVVGESVHDLIIPDPSALRAVVSVERIACALLFLGCAAGGACRWSGGRRCPVAGSALAAAAALALAGVGAMRNGSVPLTPTQFLLVGLWLAVLPAAVAVTRGVVWLTIGGGRRFAGPVVGGGLFLIVAGVVARRPLALELPEWGPQPLTIGLPADARELEDALGAVTKATARILWEDRAGSPDLGWAPLLPRRLGRAFVGGADPDGVLEHSACGLRDGTLVGRPLAAWSDPELDGYCRRYNIGWVMCATAAARVRFANWSAAEPLPPHAAAGGRYLFAIRRPHSFVLKGRVRQFEADGRRVTLADVVPEGGEVVLSLHYQAGWRARPAWVRVERELDAYDPIPFVRLRMPGPAGRVTLTWDGANGLAVDERR